MTQACIPLDSVTARCMFEPTQASGKNVCKFGPTPLWDHKLRVTGAAVLRSEFMNWTEKLIRSGQNHQRAATAPRRSR
jgi:hypothetical protein